jgi:hypothetical protein
VAAFIKAKTSPSLAVTITALTGAGLSNPESDWTLNDSPRST